MGSCMWRAPAMALCVVLSGSSTPVLSEDWPTYRHDNRRSAVTKDEFRLPASLVWVWRSSNAPVTALPGPGRRTFEGRELRHKVRLDDAFQAVFCGQRVFFGSSEDGRIICLDLALGSLKWEFFTGAAVRLAPALWQEKVYAGSDDGWVYCLDAADGQLIWKHRAAPAEEFVLARGRMTSRWPVRTGVLISEGVAYFGAGVFPHDRVYHCALDAVTGEVTWKQDRVSEAEQGRYDASPQGYLLASDKRLFVPQGRDLPGALDMLTGGMIHKRWHTWSNEAQGDVGGTAALLADGQIYHFGAHQIMAMSQERGDIGFGWLSGRRFVAAGEKGYLADGKKIVRFNRMAYLEESRNHTAKLERLKEVEKARRVAKADPRRTAELEKLTGERVQLKQATRTRLIRTKPEWVTACPHEGELILAGRLLIAGGQGEVVALDAATGERLWGAAVQGEARGLASAKGHLLVSTTAGHIYCYGPSTGQPTRHTGPGSREPDAPRRSRTWEQEARRVLALTGVRRGFCLLSGIGDGGLAASLARASELQVYAVDAEKEAVARARRSLREQRLLGDRVWVHLVKGGRLPYANYFADLAVSQTIPSHGSRHVSPAELLRVLKPGGGVACLPGEPAEDAARELLDALRTAGEGYALERRDGRLLLRRKPLSGIDWWMPTLSTDGVFARDTAQLMWVYHGGYRCATTQRTPRVPPLRGLREAALPRKAAWVCRPAVEDLPHSECCVPALARTRGPRSPLHERDHPATLVGRGELDAPAACQGSLHTTIAARLGAIDRGPHGDADPGHLKGPRRVRQIKPHGAAIGEVERVALPGIRGEVRLVGITFGQ